jgi:hypothetical protein
MWQSAAAHCFGGGGESWGVYETQDKCDRASLKGRARRRAFVRPTHAIETAEKGYSRERVRTSRIAAKWRCFKLPRACLDHAMFRLLTCGEAAFSLILARRRIGNLETPERAGGVRRHQSSFAMHDTPGHTLSVPRHLRGRRKSQLTHGRDEWDRDAGQLTASVLTGSEHSSQGALYRGADGARGEGRPAEAAAPPGPCIRYQVIRCQPHEIHDNSTVPTDH